MNRLIRFYQSFLRLTRQFFIRAGERRFFRAIGIALYKLALWVTARILTLVLPEIVAIYSLTQFDGWFMVGESDLDLAIVVENVTPEEEIKIFKRYNKIRNLIRTIFPFIWLDAYPFFCDDFRRWRFFSLSTTYRDDVIKDMELLYGQNVFDQNHYANKRIFGYGFKFSYESVLMEIYTLFLQQNNNSRVFYKYCLKIIRMFYLAENGIDGGPDDYKNFLIKFGAPASFIDNFFSLPSKKFIIDEDLAILTIFTLNKIFSILGEQKDDSLSDRIETADSRRPFDCPDEVKELSDRLDKKNINSIILTKSPFFEMDSFFLYLVLKDDLDFADFKLQVRDILMKISHLKTLREKIKIRQRDWMYITPPDIFPIILTKKSMNFCKMINGTFLFELVNFNRSALLIFGEGFTLSQDDQELKNSFFSPFYMDIILPTNSHADKFLFYRALVIRLLAETGKLFLFDAQNEYEKRFGKLNFQSLEDQSIFARKIFKKYNVLID